MKIINLIIVNLIIFSCFSVYKANSIITSDVITYEKVEVMQEETMEIKINKLIKKYSIQYNVSEHEMSRIIKCENSYLNPSLQSFMIYSKDNSSWGVKKGEREKSYGLAQIHLPSHPDITYEQAIDPDFSIEFLAKKLSIGRGFEWSCY